MPFLLSTLRGQFHRQDGTPIARLVQRVYDLDDAAGRQAFLSPTERLLVVPGTDRTVSRSPTKRIGLGLSRLGTGEATARGAYAHALDRIDRQP